MGWKTYDQEVEEIRKVGVYQFPNGQTTELHIAAFFYLTRQFVVDSLFESGQVPYRMINNRYVCLASDVFGEEFKPATNGGSTGCRDTREMPKTAKKGQTRQKRQKTQTIGK